MKIGDRVKGKEGIPGIGGKVGTIMKIDGRLCDYRVQLDELIEDGHNLIAPAEDKNGYCRWVDENKIELLSPPYFADARVGDTIYSMVYGEGEIYSIKLDSTYPLVCRFRNGYCYSYALGGYEIQTYPHQSLFYSKPIFDLPPPPKRTVKKVAEGWINLYKSNGVFFEMGRIFDTKEAADATQQAGRLGEAIFIHHEYEVAGQ